MIGSFSISIDDVHWCTLLPLLPTPPAVVGVFVLAQYTELGLSVEGCHFEPACVPCFFGPLKQLYQLSLLAVFLPHVLRVNTNACAKKNRCSAACKNNVVQEQCSSVQVLRSDQRCI
jgi:hypothetical protein